MNSRPEIVIAPSRGWLPLRWREIWEYRDLFGQLVRRDLSTRFRQTLLGPLWFVLQPLMTTAVFSVVFGRIAQLPTDNTPPALFYLCGLLSWTYFAQTMPGIAGTFTANSHLFGKVYFPRLIIPFSQMAGNLMPLALQGAVFAALWLYNRIFTGFHDQTLTPILPAVGLLLIGQVQIMVLTLGVGTLLAAATGKYRDLQHMLPVMLQLWFYATPVVYPLSMVGQEARWRWVALANPMTAPVEAFKLALLGNSSWTPGMSGVAWVVSVATLLLGLTAFVRSERTVIDVA